MANPALTELEARLEDAQRLIAIHGEASGPAAGRRYRLDVLNRAAVILSMAAWEGFVEDLLRYAVRLLATRLGGAADLPSGVRDVMLLKLHTEGNWEKLTTKAKSDIWSLAGSGWRAAYVGYATGRIRSLHTPNVENVQKLFATTIGLRDFAQDWGAKRWDRQTYVDLLEGSLTLRHRIAHGAIGRETVGKTRARNAISVVTKTASWTAGTVDRHVQAFDLRAKPLKTKPITSALEEMNRQIG